MPVTGRLENRSSRQTAIFSRNLQRAAPDQIQIQALDVTQEDASEKLNLLIDKLGGMDLFLLSSGIGFQNMDLNMEVELNTAHTNVAGFIRMVDTAFTYFKKTEVDIWPLSVPLPERKGSELLLPIPPPNVFKTLI